LPDIEATNKRRGSSGQYGAKGARIIYSHMLNALINYTFPTVIVRYAELVDWPIGARS
jgi:hypothetical protein